MQARLVVGEYRDIIAGLRTVIGNYRKGKRSYDDKRETVKQQLEESYKELHAMGKQSCCLI